MSFKLMKIFAPPVVQGLLHHDLDEKPQKLQWKYHTAVGMMLYLQNSTRPNISMAVHKTERFSNQPMLSHKKAIMRIGQYFLDTCSHGIVYKPDTTK